MTWLYGPLKTSKTFGTNTSSPPTHLTTPNMCQHRKPILKKKTASETMLQRSLSQHTLLQRAGALLKAKEAANAQDQSSILQSRHQQDRTGSTTPTAVAGTPTTAPVSDIGSPNERRHIHFNNEVVQCIAIEAKEEGEDYGEWPMGLEDGLFSGNVAMTNQMLSNTAASNRCSPRNNPGHQNKTIAPLPSTTLRGDTTPEPPASSFIERWFGSRSSTSPSPTTPPKDSRRSSEPSANFLLDDDDDDYDSNDGFDFSWQSNWQSKQVSSTSFQSRPYSVNPEDDGEDGLEMDRYFHLTYSDMFSLGEYSESPNAGIFDRVLDTVNTAKDIAHVIWNVGWRR